MLCYINYQIWGAFTYLHVELTALDVLCFVSAADLDRDGNLSFREFVDILTVQDEDGGGTGEGIAVVPAPLSPSPSLSPSLSLSRSSSGSLPVPVPPAVDTEAMSVDSETIPMPVELVRSQSLRSRSLRRQVSPPVFI